MEAMSPGYGSEAEKPLHRDVAEHIDSLKKENFNLKLRIYHMEEHISSKGGQDWRNIIQQKVEVWKIFFLQLKFATHHDKDTQKIFFCMW